MTTIKQFIMTVGVQYTNDDRYPETVHPLGVTGDGYTVIEAPDKETARNLAFALTDGKFAFIYDREEYGEDRLADYHPAGEQLRIAWLERGDRRCSA